MFGIIALAVLGLVAGALAKWILPGEDPGGWIVTILIGVAGSLLGSFLSTVLPFLNGNFGELSIPGIISAVVGSLVLLIGYRFLVKGKSK
ncbi:MAG: GlsB/YeaQ/YmgE family stress response membrane protein [Bacteroidia bacterium]|nr:GlsB/YeaQ/YmgE family stress response membrane protein [Bacteroidia bacterium]